MPNRRAVVHLVTALVCLTLVTDSQNTGNYTEEYLPTAGDEYSSSDNVTISASAETPTISLIAAGAPETGTPGLAPRASAESNVTDGPSVLARTTQPIRNSSACVCDITTDFCDIGCCCDVVDCGIADLSSVFSGCKQDDRPGVCVESWLMFRANVDPALVTVTDSLFCVRRGDEQGVVAPPLPGLLGAPFSISSPHFSLQEPTPYPSRYANLYKVDDIILAYYNDTSVVSVLSQPSPGATSACVDRNPAKFLRSSTLSCSRAVSSLSCMRGSGLSVRSYSTGFGLLRIPHPSKEDMANLTIPVISLSDQPEPIQHSGSCLNVVSKVEYTVTYTGTGEITWVTVNVDVTNASFNTQLLQQHSVQFQLATPSPPPSRTPLVGLMVGRPVIGWFGEEAQPLTVQGLSVGGDCSVDTLNRSPILFKHNTITGCTFRSASRDCASLQAQLYSILRGVANPDRVAMTAGSQPDWSRVIIQECPNAPAGELCETGCLLPVSLFIQVLWAQRGLLALPQSHILGAKYSFSCQTLQCPITSPVPVTTEVIFSDSTVYPETPLGTPQPEWKFPFSFFTRGAGELDGE